MKQENLDQCQIVCLPQVTEGSISIEKQALSKQIKRLLAKPWNYTVKAKLKWFVKSITTGWNQITSKNKQAITITTTKDIIHLQAGDNVRVRSREEIASLLDLWKEYRGCAFLDSMWQYCGTDQRVFRVVNRFLDERDYQVKRTKGLVLLEGIFCEGTPVFGRCDRSCLLFWREEWLEKIE